MAQILNLGTDAGSWYRYHMNFLRKSAQNSVSPCRPQATMRLVSSFCRAMQISVSAHVRLLTTRCMKKVLSCLAGEICLSTQVILAKQFAQSSHFIDKYLSHADLMSKMQMILSVGFISPVKLLPILSILLVLKVVSSTQFLFQRELSFIRGWCLYRSLATISWT